MLYFIAQNFQIGRWLIGLSNGRADTLDEFFLMFQFSFQRFELILEEHLVRLELGQGSSALVRGPALQVSLDFGLYFSPPCLDGGLRIAPTSTIDNAITAVYNDAETKARKASQRQ